MIKRVEKYKAKVSGEVTADRIERYGDQQKKNFATSVGEQVEIEKKVKQFLAQHNISPLYTNYYILFAKNLLKKRGTEAEIEFNKWAGRDINYIYLRLLANKLFNIRPELKVVSRIKGCVLNLSFYENQGNTVHDLSGYNNNGTIYGAQWVDGIIGKALDFDGTDDYVEVPDSDSLDITDEISILLWFNPQQLDMNQYLVDKHVSSPFKAFFVAFWGTNRIRFTLYDESGGSTEIFSSKVFNSGDLNKWWHIAATFNGTLLKIFINGKKDVEGTSGISSIGINERNLTIGSSNARTFFFKGLIDEVRVYNRALSEEEIKLIYEAEKPLH